MLQRCREMFDYRAGMSLLLVPQKLREPFVTPEWSALGRLAASLSINDFRSGQTMEPESARRFTVNRTMYYIRTLDKSLAARRLREKMEKWKRLQGDMRDAAKYIDQNVKATQEGHRLRAEVIRGLRRDYAARPDDPDVSVHLLPSPQAVQWGRPRPDGDFTGRFGEAFKELSMRRKTARISLLADVSDTEIILGAARSATPKWVETLQGCINSIMPNHRLLPHPEEGYPVQEVVPEPITTAPERAAPEVAPIPPPPTLS
jgi:hypothetical protein